MEQERSTQSKHFPPPRRVASSKCTRPPDSTAQITRIASDQTVSICESLRVIEQSVHRGSRSMISDLISCVIEMYSSCSLLGGPQRRGWRSDGLHIVDGARFITFSNTRFSILVFEYSFWKPCSNIFEYSNNRFSTAFFWSRVPVGLSSGLRLGGKCSISPSSLTTQRVPKEFVEGWRKAVSYPYFDQQNTLQRSTSGKSGVLNAFYTFGVNGSVEKSWSWETEVKVTSGRQTSTFVRRGADHWNDRIRRKKNALCLFVAAALVPRQGRSTACPDAM